MIAVRNIIPQRPVAASLCGGISADPPEVEPYVEKTEPDDQQNQYLLNHDDRIHQNPYKDGNLFFVKVKGNNGDALEKIDGH